MSVFAFAVLTTPLVRGRARDETPLEHGMAQRAGYVEYGAPLVRGRARDETLLGRGNAQRARDETLLAPGLAPQRTVKQEDGSPFLNLLLRLARGLCMRVALSDVWFVLVHSVTFRSLLSHCPGVYCVVVASTSTYVVVDAALMGCGCL